MNSKKVYTAIMCGGEGKRLWPLSRRSFPKYYIPLADGESLFQKSFRRALLVSNYEDILLVTTEINRHNALKQARAILPSFPSNNLVIRPEGKETFATLACALGIMHDRKAADNDILICSPADHVISDNIGFKKSLLDAIKIADDSLITIGILPTHPSSDFGYIEHHPKELDQIHHLVKRFTEKPDQATAASFLEQGNYLWNGGYYIGTKATYLREIIEQSESAAEIIMSGSLGISKRFEELPEKSIDYVLAEKVAKMHVVPASFDWYDYGDLVSFTDARGREQKQFTFNGDNISACADGKLVVTSGVSDLMIVDTRDAILVAHKDSLSDLSKVVNALRDAKHHAVDHQLTGHRPWGSFEVFEESDNYNIKKITIDPGCSSSTQTHLKRSEHWVIIAGTAKVTLSGVVQFLHTSESLHIPKDTKHRIENPMTEPLVLIEVQTGTDLDEDDIQREDDDYLREKPIKI